ncbi:MAG: HAD family hydrolase [Leptolyngbyaceae cyanobacterium MO_188.B28]|nr:HAD family hydrolase [Leptolyngbyaceae cyanobacterium MO_188.B28]
MADLIIFDCDGVLVDSETISNRILMEMLNDLGWRIGFEETVDRFTGLSTAMCLEIIEGRLGGPIPSDFEQVMDEREAEAFKRDLQPVPGIKEVLDGLTLPKCVASSGTHEKMTVSLGVTGLYKFFEDRIFSATEVERAKPYPDLFLYAAERMGVAPSRCVVIEDSVPGVQGGIAAGMIVMGYANLTSSQALAQAGARVFSHMRELPELIQSL